MSLPLSKIRVLDFTRILSGPYCTMKLGDMGAEIIKIEARGSGDDTRYWAPPYVGEESVYFLSVNRNKKSITLDLKSKEGKEILSFKLDDYNKIIGFIGYEKSNRYLVFKTFVLAIS